MPRKTTAKQVKHSRFVLKLSLGLLCAAACAVILIFIFSGSSSQARLISPYAEQTAEESVQAPAGTGNEPELFARNLCVVTDESAQDPAVVSEAGIIFNRTTGEVLFSKNAYERLYPASVTKLMTCLVALKYGDLSSQVTVRYDMLANLDPESSVCNIKDGDTLTLEQLLYGLMLPSGNDAANAIAYGVAGSESAFVEMMNNEARQLGATDTHFVNAHGLNDPNHYTTAYDIYLIFNELINYNKFLEIIGAQEYTAEYTNNGQTVTNTWYRGIWYFGGQAEAPDGVTVLGGKTGTTPEAQYCLSLASEDGNGNQYISVVLKAPTREMLYSSMTALLSKIPK